MLHAICTADNVYGYLKSTLAKTILFSNVTKILLKRKVYCDN